MKKGIKETKEAAILAFSLSNAFGEIMEDGKFSILETFTVLKAMLKAKEGITGIKEIPAEIKDLDIEEKTELMALLKEELDLEDTTEEFIEKCISLVLNAYELYELGKTLKKKD